MSATLKAAQRQFDVLPAVSVLVSDNPPEAPRLAELALVDHSGSIADLTFDAWFSSAGKIGRVYNDGAGNIYAQAVDPSSPTWATYSLLSAIGANFANGQQVAIWGNPAGSDFYAFWVENVNRDVYTARYTGTWSAKALVYSFPPGQTVTGLAACQGDPTPRLFAILGAEFLYETHWTGAAWSAPLADGVAWNATPTIGAGFRPVGAPTGDGNAYVLVAWDAAAAGAGPTQLLVKQFGIGTFAGWGSSAVLLDAAASGYLYRYPRLAETRADSLRQVVSWSEVASSSAIGTLAMVGFTPSHLAIQGAVPWRYTATHGIRVFRDVATSPSWWFLTSQDVYSAAADVGVLVSGQRWSFSQEQIQAFRIDSPNPNTRSSGFVSVLNLDGVLHDAGLAGTHRCLRPGSQVAIALGYRGSIGLETAWQIPLWVASVVFHDEVARGQPLVTFNLIDAWGVLESLQYRSTVTYTGQTAEYLLQRAFWHVCGYLGSLSGLLSGLTVSPFTVKAGESVASVARRLCDLAGVDLVFRTNAASVDGAGLDSVGVVAVARGSGGSVYSYGSGGTRHPVVQSEIAPASWPAETGVQVAGLTTISLVRNWGPTWLTWRDQLARTVDKTLANQAATDAVASNRAGSALAQGASGSIQVLANVGQEVSDQVDLTIASAGLSGAVFTVRGVTTSWVTDSGLTPNRTPLRGQLVQLLKLEGSR